MVRRQGIVLSRKGGRYCVAVQDEIKVASLRGRMKLHEERVLVGDRVTIEEGPQGAATIEAVADRQSVLRRRNPGKRRGARAVAANLDQVVVVGATQDPDWDDGLMDRFTTVAEANGLPVVIVINKCDLAADVGPRLARPYEMAGYPVLLTSAVQPLGLEVLRTRLAQRVSVLTGPSGVGKSTLLNVLNPGLRLRTREVTRRGGAGRHTTVAAEMHPFPPSGYVVDTPGLRDIGLWGLEPLDVSRAFPEILRLAPGCRFDNCRHAEEPGCAVTAAAERGDLAASRLVSYRRLLREALEASRPWQ